MLLSTAQHNIKNYTANIMTTDAHNINQFLDEQLLDLEQRFSQFMKEMEDDLIFPSFKMGEESAKWDDDDLFMEDTASNRPTKQFIAIDRHTTVLCVTGSITVTVLVYLGMVLSS